MSGIRVDPLSRSLSPDLFLLKHRKPPLSVGYRECRAKLGIFKCIPSSEFLRRLFERFSEEAMKAVMLSEEETDRQCHIAVGSDKILAGLVLVGPEAAIAAKVLDSMGITPEAVCVEADRIVDRPSKIWAGLKPKRKTGNTPMDIRFTDTALHTLKLSYQEARKLGHNYIGSGHLLLGIVSHEESLAAQVLANLGAKASTIREEVTRLMAGENNKETILELKSYQPSVEDVAKVDEAIRELEKKLSQVKEETTEDFDDETPPRRFVTANGLDKGLSEIVLKNGWGGRWTLVLKHYESYRYTYIKRGWTSFCQVNGIKAGDSLMFQLVKTGEKPVLSLCPSNGEKTPLECPEGSDDVSPLSSNTSSGDDSRESQESEEESLGDKSVSEEVEKKKKFSRCGASSSYSQEHRPESVPKLSLQHSYLWELSLLLA
ncbi:unnamed protein product [Microthlaspi erraticum]|uniref:TF-B3 domain-containing protein n=1 Tax=Microthlaspi erraticum TaxID=1685480 RepID=A0A6D2J8F8_9BRAS|nr:unnamed protein product [Microthlaspi erraticum]